jgi:hypothetical protein
MGDDDDLAFVPGFWITANYVVYDRHGLFYLGFAVTTPTGIPAPIQVCVVDRGIDPNSFDAFVWYESNQ